MDRQEQQLIAEIKRHAKKGDQSTANALAKQLVRLRNQRTKTTVAKSRLQGISSQATAMQSQARVAQSMGTAAKVVTSMNKQIDVQQMQETMRKFEQESTKMDMAGEMMDEALDSMFDEEGIFVRFGDRFYGILVAYILQWIYLFVVDFYAQVSWWFGS